jgi:hypothetical protein
VAPLVAAAAAPAGHAGGQWAAGGASALAVAVSGLGYGLYPAFRGAVRPALHAHGEWAAKLFEVKEHLAVAVLLLALAGLVAARRGAQGPSRQAARQAYLGAAVLATATTVLGVWVSSLARFALATP